MSKEQFLQGASPLNIVYLADGNIQRKLTRAELATFSMDNIPKVITMTNSINGVLSTPTKETPSTYPTTFSDKEVL